MIRLPVKNGILPQHRIIWLKDQKKVQINSQPACRNGDRSTCEAKIDHTQESRVVRIGGNKEVVRDIISGRNPFCTFVGEAVGAVLGGLGEYYPERRNGCCSSVPE
ncbi:hypothetical protein WKC53_14810 [Morganella morganii]|uniref:hypothetical protein n=1 Tax=Morganella morganii TaxID=582 RepID=UPI0030FECF61